MTAVTYVGKQNEAKDMFRSPEQTRLTVKFAVDAAHPSNRGY